MSFFVFFPYFQQQTESERTRGAQELQLLLSPPKPQNLKQKPRAAAMNGGTTKKSSPISREQFVSTMAPLIDIEKVLYFFPAIFLQIFVGQFNFFQNFELIVIKNSCEFMLCDRFHYFWRMKSCMFICKLGFV